MKWDFYVFELFACARYSLMNIHVFFAKADFHVGYSIKTLKSVDKHFSHFLFNDAVGDKKKSDIINIPPLKNLALWNKNLHNEVQFQWKKIK